jgi:hypothetical protein
MPGHASQSPGRAPGYDATSDPNEYASGTTQSNQETYLTSLDTSSLAQDPACLGNTPLALDYARDATPEYAQTATPESEKVLRAAPPMVPADHGEAGGASASPPAAEKPPASSGSAAPAPAAPAASGPVVVASAATPASPAGVVRAARPAGGDEGALTASASVSRGADQDRDSEEPLDPGTEVPDSQAPAPLPQFASLLAGSAPVDLPALQRGVDQFFTRLEAVGEELPKGPLLLRLAPWVASVALSTAALEVARWQMRKQAPRRTGCLVRPSPEES